MRRRSAKREMVLAAATLLATASLAACTASCSPSPVSSTERASGGPSGTYPGADGIPVSNGVPTVRVPNPAGSCTRPYHDIADINGGGPHGEANAVADVSSGQMNGFIVQRDKAKSTCNNPDDPAGSIGGTPDIMGYHTDAEIPNYWTYAS